MDFVPRITTPSHTFCYVHYSHLCITRRKLQGYKPKLSRSEMVKAAKIQAAYKIMSQACAILRRTRSNNMSVARWPHNDYHV